MKPPKSSAHAKQSHGLRICILMPAGEAVEAAYSALADDFAGMGHEVTILLCGEDSGANRNKNIAVIPLPACKGADILSPLYIRRPYEAYLWLKEKAFDVIHYPDSSGMGHYICSARRQGLAFADTVFCAGAVRPTLRGHDKDGRFLKSPGALSVDFMERMSVANADMLIEFDADALDWMKEQDWALPKTIRTPPKKGADWHTGFKRAKKAAKPARETAPLISICLTHHDRPAFLQQALDSIEAQDYPHYEVVLVDDGSTDAEALKLLDRLEPIFRKKKWQLIRQENLYQGAAINAAAKRARGAYIKLMDDDNIAKPHELSTFMRVARATGADIVTCMLDGFYGDAVPTPGQYRAYRYLFIGPAIAVGAFQNAFGDNNALIRRKTFLALGGFCEDYGRGYTDWEFFARAVLKGYRLETVPEALVWSRHTPGSMLRTTGAYENAMLSLRPYLAMLPPELRPLLMLARGMNEKDPADSKIADLATAAPRIRRRPAG